MALAPLNLVRVTGQLSTRERIGRPVPAVHTRSAWHLPQHLPMPQAPRREEFMCMSYSGSGSNSTAQKREAQLEVLRKELKALEDERDEAVSIAESCAKTCVRLTDMSKLLEDLALEKVKAGDDGAAKLVLQEKNSLREIIDKSNTKAQTNFALAGKLAALIGEKHNQLVGLLGGGQAGSGGGGGGGVPPAGASSGRASATSYGTGSWPEPWTSAAGSYGNSSGFGAGASDSGGAFGGGDYTMPWQKSLNEAQNRVRQAEVEAQNMGRLAAMSAEDSIAAARERLGQRVAGPRSSEDILQARTRLRRSAEESIAEARERLRAQDTQILEYCRRIVTRYRRGEYVSEDELEFAFEQLERRLL